jgi:hypothetical protein
MLGSERLTGALLDRLTHHVSILSLNGDSYRLKSSRSRRGRAVITQGVMAGFRRQWFGEWRRTGCCR